MALAAVVALTTGIVILPAYADHGLTTTHYPDVFAVDPDDLGHNQLLEAGSWLWHWCVPIDLRPDRRRPAVHRSCDGPVSGSATWTDADARWAADVYDRLAALTDSPMTSLVYAERAQRARAVADADGPHADVYRR